MKINATGASKLNNKSGQTQYILMTKTTKFAVKQNS